jgi:hypothetical protein
MKHRHCSIVIGENEADRSSFTAKAYSVYQLSTVLADMALLLPTLHKADVLCQNRLYPAALAGCQSFFLC